MPEMVSGGQDEEGMEGLRLNRVLILMVLRVCLKSDSGGLTELLS